MARYSIVDKDGIYFTTHTILEWLPVFKEIKYFEIIIESLKYCQENLEPDFISRIRLIVRSDFLI
ncbi:MAG: hypothetical protein ACE5HO_07250 [bacterium]